MRVDVRKFLFVGAQNSLGRFLEAMQASGLVQFVAKPKPIADLMGAPVYDVLRALKVLSHYGEGLFGLEKSTMLIRNPAAFASEVLAMRDEVEKIDGALKVLSARLVVRQFFGAIPWNDIDELEARSSICVRFFEGPTSRQFDQVVPQLLPIHEAGEKSSFVSFLFTESALPSGLREIPKEELKGLATQKKELIVRRAELEDELKRRSAHRTSLRNALSSEIDHARLQETQETHQREIEDTLFVMTGWVPESSRQKVSEVGAEYHVICEEVLSEPGEVIPTYLENRGWGRVGEDLVHIYDTPSNQDKDPSWWVLGFFSLFFSMIVGDAGYGLVFLGIALYFRRKKVASALGRRVISLVTLLGTGSVIWGLLCHSFFGLSLAHENPIRKASLLTHIIERRAEYHLSHGMADPEMVQWVQGHDGMVPKTVDEFLYTPDSGGDSPSDGYSDNALFEIALLIGVVHILLGMMRYVPKNFGYIGWILFVVGAYIYFPSSLDTTSCASYIFGLDALHGARIGKELMTWGGGGALFYAIVRHGILGIFDCMIAVQLFADTLSYLRLYALGLAGSLVSKMINEAASTMPFVVGVLLFLVSHALNIVLSTVGGIIHGLRLNFLEWYHYSFEGGGKNFTPLCLEEKK